MSELEKNESIENEDLNPDLEPEPEEEEEFGILDKMIGVFTEPSATFAKMAKMELKVTDWLVPFLISVVVTVIAISLQTFDPQIKMQQQEMQLEKMRKNMQEQVDAGRMSQAQVDGIIEQTRGNMERFGGVIGMAMGLVGGLIIGGIMTLIIAGYFFMLTKLILKGEGSFTHSLVAVCMPGYIGAFGAIVSLILAMAFTKFLPGLNLTALLGLDPMSTTGFLIHFIDVFAIWGYVVLAIGLAKLFKTKETGKSIAMVLSSWVVFSALWWGVKSAVPFLQNFGF